MQTIANAMPVRPDLEAAMSYLIARSVTNNECPCKRWLSMIGLPADPLPALLPADANMRTRARERYVGGNLCPSSTKSVTTQPIDAFQVLSMVAISVFCTLAGLVVHLVNKTKDSAQVQVLRTRAATGLVRAVSRTRSKQAKAGEQADQPSAAAAAQPPGAAAPLPQGLGGPPGAQGGGSAEPNAEGMMQVVCPPDAGP